jgi:transcriptional antiterminator NusG
VYYVIQVTPGKETETEKYIMERVSKELYTSCFHPMRHVRKKFHGEWRDRHEKLLPGYVFISSENVEELYLDLKRIPVMTKLLGWEKEFIAALTDQETMWLEKIVSADRAGKMSGDVPLSRIEVKENEEVKILSGPLKDMDGMIKRINLHKRKAEVEVEFLGRKTILHLGIEMIRKK